MNTHVPCTSDPGGNTGSRQGSSAETNFRTDDGTGRQSPDFERNCQGNETVPREQVSATIFQHVDGVRCVPVPHVVEQVVDVPFHKLTSSRFLPKINIHSEPWNRRLMNRCRGSRGSPHRGHIHLGSGVEMPQIGSGRYRGNNGRMSWTSQRIATVRVEWPGCNALLEENLKRMFVL